VELNTHSRAGRLGARLHPRQARYRALCAMVPVNVKLFSGSDAVLVCT